jgi:hypothetical protein
MSPITPKPYAFQPGTKIPFTYQDGSKRTISLSESSTSELGTLDWTVKKPGRKNTFTYGGLSLKTAAKITMQDTEGTATLVHPDSMPKRALAVGHIKEDSLFKKLMAPLHWVADRIVNGYRK